MKRKASFIMILCVASLMGLGCGDETEDKKTITKETVAKETTEKMPEKTEEWVRHDFNVNAPNEFGGNLSVKLPPTWKEDLDGQSILSGVSHIAAFRDTDIKLVIVKLPPNATAFDVLDTVEKGAINDGLVSERNPLTVISVSMNENTEKYVWGFCEGKAINNGVVINKRTYAFEFHLFIRQFDTHKALMEKIIESSSCTAGIRLF